MSSEVTLASAIAGLICEKRATGYKYVSEERTLARFEAFCASEFPGVDTVTRACVEAWIAAARGRAVKPATVINLIAPVRELARWLGRRGVEAYVLPGGGLPKPARYIPYIYTDRELAALFTQTDRCHYCPEVPFRHLVMPVLFRTIYACGLRCSEARLLRVTDVDVENGVLQIRDAKGGKDRQLPVSEPLRERLAGQRQPQLPAVSVAGADPAPRPRTRPPCPRSATRDGGQQPPILVCARRERGRAAAGAANVPGALLDRRYRLLPALDRGVLPGHQQPGQAGVRRDRPRRDRTAG